MNAILRLKDLEHTTQQRLMNILNKLCEDQPLSIHCYAIYYLTYEPHRTELLLMTSGSNIRSYVLVWYGGKFIIQDIYEVHIWNPISDIVSKIDIPPNKRVDIQLYNSTLSDIEIVKKHFKALGFRRFSIEEFYDMVCDRESFNPSPLEKLAVKLSEEHALLYKDLELERGVEISVDEAREILKEYTHYGVIINNVLASIAARYITLPRIHLIGGVFTRKRYRGKGYAKAVTSALTRDAIASGAIVGLHVEVSNKPAIKVYRSLGYKVIRTRTWIFAHP